MRLVLLSDTHGLHRKISIPDGDVLVHAGDFRGEGEAVEARSFGAFLRGLPHPNKAVISGIHDRSLEADPSLGPEVFAGCQYLLDSGVEIDSVTFRGSPWQPWFFDIAFKARVLRRDYLLRGPRHGECSRVSLCPRLASRWLHSGSGASSAAM